MTDCDLPVPTWRIKMVEEIWRSTRQQREEWISAAHYNLLSLQSSQVFIDLLTDRGTSAMSVRQWDALTHVKDTWARSSSITRIKSKVRQTFGLEHVLPLREGLGGERILLSLLVDEDDVIPANSHSDTSRAHIEHRLAIAVDCPLDEAFCIEKYHPFKGNVDIPKLESVLSTETVKVPFILISITCDQTGGQPVSIRNLRQVKQMAREYGVPVVLNSTHLAENACFIQKREPNYASKSIKEIVGEMHQYADAMIMGGDKYSLMNAGNILAMRDDTWYKKALNSVVLFHEKHASWGEVADRDIEALEVLLDEFTREDHLRSSMDQVWRFGEKLKKAGIPIQQPVGGHAIVIDAAAFLPFVPREEFVAQTLAVELYLEAGVRGMEIGTLMNDRDPVTGNNRYAEIEFMRLTIPGRVYMDAHLDVAAEALIKIYQRRSTIRNGFYIIEESGPLRYFTVMLAKVVEEETDTRENSGIKKPMVK